MGPFSHVIMGGSFHASIVPLCIGLYLGTRRHLPLVFYGVVGCTLGVFGANSSGALAAWLGGLGGMSMWVARRYINMIWKSLFVLLFVLHLVMEKPVWHLLVRAAELTGGGGYHRYLLIDACVRRLPEWALLGTKSTAHWGWGLQDVTNQWVLEAVNGGLATLVAFNCVLFFAFKLIGDAHKNMRRNPSVGRRMRNQSMAVGWALGVSLVAHCVAFLSVSYFGQLKAVFAMSIAMIAAHYETTRRSRSGRRSRTPAKKKAAAKEKKAVEKNGGRAPAGSRHGPGSTGTNDAPAPSLGAALVGPTARHQAQGTAAPPGRRADPGDGGKAGG
jgi:hypothetical protein